MAGCTPAWNVGVKGIGVIGVTAEDAGGGGISDIIFGGGTKTELCMTVVGELQPEQQ